MSGSTNPTKIKEFVNKKLKDHPAPLLVYLSFLGSSIIFIFLMVALYATTPTDNLDILPKYFSYSTILLLLTSYPISRLVVAFETHKTLQITKCFITILFGGSIFMILQLAGWNEMQAYISLNSTHIRSFEFLYLLSGLHLLHVLVLMTITGYFAIYYARKFSDPVKQLITVTNPFEGLRLKLIAHSWFFLHIVWAAIFGFFLLIW